jgi:hypothetical protein
MADEGLQRFVTLWGGVDERVLDAEGERNRLVEVRSAAPLQGPPLAHLSVDEVPLLVLLGR